VLRLEFFDGTDDQPFACLIDLCSELESLRMPHAKVHERALDWPRTLSGRRHRNWLDGSLRRDEVSSRRANNDIVSRVNGRSGGKQRSARRSHRGGGPPNHRGRLPTSVSSFPIVVEQVVDAIRWRAGEGMRDVEVVRQGLSWDEYPSNVTTHSDLLVVCLGKGGQCSTGVVDGC
jgi:hypothetical protein